MKSSRQIAILDVISHAEIDTQEQLADALRRQGFQVTQATVSRDIKELRLVKVPSESGGYKYSPADQADSKLSERFRRMLADSVTSLSHAYNQIVIKTLPGSANVAAEAIDGMRWPEVLGTLAGDNTLLMILRDEAEVEAVLKRIEEIAR